MCSALEELVNEGLERGRAQGLAQGQEKEKMSLAQIMIEEKEPAYKITKYTGYTIEKLKGIAESIGKTLVL